MLGISSRFRRLLAVILLSSAALLGSPSAHAAAGGLWALGLDFGVAFPNTSSAAIAWGLQFTRRFSPAFGLQFGFQEYGSGITVDSGTSHVEVNDSHSFFGLKPAYYFIGGGGLWQFGMKLGYSQSSITSTSSDGTNTISVNDTRHNWFIGPSVGYDVPVGAVTAGFEATYLMGLGDLPPKALVLVGTVKYWF